MSPITRQAVQAHRIFDKWGAENSRTAIGLDRLHELGLILAWSTLKRRAWGRNIQIKVSQQAAGRETKFEEQDEIWGEIALLLLKAVVMLWRPHPQGHSRPSRDLWRFPNANFRSRLQSRRDRLASVLDQVIAIDTLDRIDFGGMNV
jgi:hypothetical protein